MKKKEETTNFKGISETEAAGITLSLVRRLISLGFCDDQAIAVGTELMGRLTCARDMPNTTHIDRATIDLFKKRNEGLWLKQDAISQITTAENLLRVRCQQVRAQVRS